jgi:hypothetical protein
VLAEQQLPDPERHPLLSDAAWALEQHGGGQRLPAHGFENPFAELVVAEQGDDGHAPES